jgi:hypothetical protein
MLNFLIVSVINLCRRKPIKIYAPGLPAFGQHKRYRSRHITPPQVMPFFIFSDRGNVTV